MLRHFKKNFFKCLRPLQVSLFYDFKNLNTGILENYLLDKVNISFPLEFILFRVGTVGVAAPI